jgi:asparagine synthase (glutamine-hydrolysing)
MCGINGYNWSDKTLIEEMNRVTENRGPDDRGIYIDGSITLGHTRLSIIDLSSNGHQPMSNETGTIWITYNGEVYNFQDLKGDLLNKGHSFKSNTDTEVLIHAYEEYGFNFINKLNGMWAFCLYDKSKGLLILSRDQFGIKPLYYYLDDKKIIFSSMIGAILRHGIDTSPNDKAIMEYLAFNLEDHGTQTFFNNINSIPPDSLLIFDLNTKKCRFHRWYTPSYREIKNKDELKELFIESVRLRTVSDVPIGSCLSGGIDSSAIVCTLDRLLNHTFYTFSLIAPGSPLDESKYIKEIGKHAKIKQFFTTLSVDTFLNEFRDFLVTQEEPVIGLSPYAQYAVLKLAHEQGAKVLLDGQGGDEIFAGYEYYFGYLFYELLASLKWYTLAREMMLYTKNFKNFYPHKMFLFLLLPEFIKYPVWNKLLNTWINRQLLTAVCGNERDPRWKRMGLREGLRLTLYSTAIPHLLRWEDKNSMRWSIETRPPFLDYLLVESAISMPSGTKLLDGKTKVMFKEAMRDVLPEMIKNRKDKMGFEAPVSDFFRDVKVKKFCTDIINSESFKNRPYWDSEEVNKIFQSHFENKKDHGVTIWKFINLEMWLRTYFNREKVPKANALPILVANK